MTWRMVLAGLVLAAGPAGAVVAVADPVPPVGTGYRLDIARVTQLPALSASLPRTGAQGLRGPDDRSGRLFVNDTRGILYVSRGGGAPAPYLDLRAQNVGFSNAADRAQTGLMGVAFHPNFNRDPKQPGYRTLYTVDTTDPSAGTARWGTSGPASHHDVVREWTVADPAADVAEVTATREVMRVAQRYKDHGAGTIGFNPGAAPGDGDYGKLYIGLGDGGGTGDPDNNAQNRQSPFGKILRIDPADPDGAGPASYSVPADNPFVNDPDARGEVWATGLRNPQHFSWDSSGRMLIADISQAQLEEVNLGRAGANYGWPEREGTFARGDKSDPSVYAGPTPDGFTDPIGQYDHGEIGGAAGIGGAFLYEGGLIPELVGKVVLSDLVSGRLFYFTLPPVGATGPAILSEFTLTSRGRPFTFGEAEGYGGQRRVDLRLGRDPSGELYLLTKRDGAIYRLRGITAVPEAATWATMIAGFVLVGVSLRRKRRRVRPA